MLHSRILTLPNGFVCTIEPWVRVWCGSSSIFVSHMYHLKLALLQPFRSSHKVFWALMPPTYWAVTGSPCQLTWVLCCKAAHLFRVRYLEAILPTAPRWVKGYPTTGMILQRKGKKSRCQTAELRSGWEISLTKRLKRKKMERKKRKSVQSSSGKNIDPMSASHFYELFCEVFEVQATRNHWWFSSLPSPSLWKEIPTPRAAATSDHLEEELSGLIISLWRARIL